MVEARYMLLLVTKNLNGLSCVKEWPSQPRTNKNIKSYRLHVSYFDNCL